MLYIVTFQVWSMFSTKCLVLSRFSHFWRQIVGYFWTWTDKIQISGFFRFPSWEPWSRLLKLVNRKLITYRARFSPKEGWLRCIIPKVILRRGVGHSLSDQWPVYFYHHTANWYTKVLGIEVKSIWLYRLWIIKMMNKRLMYLRRYSYLNGGPWGNYIEHDLA